MDCARLFDEIGYVVTIKMEFTCRWYLRGRQHGPTGKCIYL